MPSIYTVYHYILLKIKVLPDYHNIAFRTTSFLTSTQSSFTINK